MSSLVLSRPIIIGVGGVTSNVGKTTLVCELLTAFPGWEAIKTTRGHYRSCGKDSTACCVSDLLAEEPVLRSGRAETFEAGKDTGRYWEAGAANVHWVIATDSQVEKGIRLALARVKSAGVFIEGNSFTQFVPTDYFLMVSTGSVTAVKKSAKRAFDKTSAIYLSGPPQGDLSGIMPVEKVPLYTPADLPFLIAQLRVSAGS